MWDMCQIQDVVSRGFVVTERKTFRKILKVGFYPYWNMEQNCPKEKKRKFLLLRLL
jgi:hypothetical protein